MLFAYFTPEVALPVASVVAATFGFFMLVGRGSVQVAKRACVRVFRLFKS